MWDDERAYRSFLRDTLSRILSDRSRSIHHRKVILLYALLRLLHNPAMRKHTPCLHPNKRLRSCSSHKALFWHVTHHCDLKLSMLRQVQIMEGCIHSCFGGLAHKDEGQTVR